MTLVDKPEYMCFNQKGDISRLNAGSLKLVGKFTHIGSSVSSTENNINMRLGKVWTTIDIFWIIWKSDLSDKTKHNFFQAAVESIIRYGGISWTLTKCIMKKLDSNCTIMLQAILNKSCKEYLTKQQLYGYLPPIPKTNQIRRTSHAGFCGEVKVGS